MGPIRTAHDELRDIEVGTPLIDASTGEATGIHFGPWLGAGGMATVFQADRDATVASSAISNLCPTRLVLKLNKLSTERELERLGILPSITFQRELVALGRAMQVQPPTEFVLALYGSGALDVDDGIRQRRLVWLALELVDEGADGATLRTRVERAREHVDPVRLLRLVKGIFGGVAVLHDVGVVHRDLKPENVFVAGPIDDETPKVADCGIARVDGLSLGTMAAMTLAYGAPEQSLSSIDPLRSNPIIGPWSDVHALAAIVWFLLTGEDWCRSDNDGAWLSGERRSLRTAKGLHAGFSVLSRPAVDEIDRVLQRGASPRPPEAAWSVVEAAAYREAAHRRFGTAMFRGESRHPNIEALSAELLPLLEDYADKWSTSAARSNRAATAFRVTRLPSLKGPDLATPRNVLDPSMAGSSGDPGSFIPVSISQSGVVFHPDGRALARAGDELYYFVSDKPHRVRVPPSLKGMVKTSHWLGRGPSGGFAMVGPNAVLLVRGGLYTEVKKPTRPSGDATGAIQAIVADGRVFAVVTSETPDTDGCLELWRSLDGSNWVGPTAVPLGGDAKAAAYGPHGYLVVGARANGRARAALVHLDDRITLYPQSLTSAPPLVAAVSGADASWAAGAGAVVRFDFAGATVEPLELAERPVALALDLVGSPWVVSSHAVLRRIEQGAPRWVPYYVREVERPELVGIGFTHDGARVLDAQGRMVSIEPPDLEEWRSGRAKTG